ncbi:hypothetical protein ACM46_05530 [Chryseobacterium angstadtii]|uniref:Lipoprotein n=1 Tax=Chryseobacterium angstadtii TaxID=558151 RepID=A0A0J7IH98_9FLAO|nr:hypothetical protein [Chryseobacterium angstadtii]KMQ65366.1 hypothetical protein ACM46_05530 [Chryseobacterium angstadtii]
MKKIIIPILMLTLVTACKKNPEKPVPNVIDSMAQAKEKNIENTAQKKKTDEEAIRKTNDEILLALKNKDYKGFAAFIHPEKGISFSMYALVNPKEDMHFSKEDFEKSQPAKTLFTWGAQDGSGDPYKASINDYFTKWVFSKDFTASQYSLNKFQAAGNSLNNLKEIYPGKDFTENYIKGTEKNGEMDWKTLRFVFEEFQGKQYLIAVVNDQWTI